MYAVLVYFLSLRTSTTCFQVVVVVKLETLTLSFFVSFSDGSYIKAINTSCGFAVARGPHAMNVVEMWMAAGVPEFYRIVVAGLTTDLSVAGDPSLLKQAHNYSLIVREESFNGI